MRTGVVTGLLLPTLVADNASLKDSEKMLCARIISLAGESGTTEVSNEELASYNGVHPGTMSYLVGDLQRSGLIDIQLIYGGRGKGRKRIIRLTEELKEGIRADFPALSA